MALYGIDISNHKNGIDLNAVEYDILGLKATEGRGYRDNCMEKFSDQNRAGKNRDEVYFHFVSTNNTAHEEAFNFINKVKNRLRPQDCVVLDWEGPGRDNGSVWARAWLQMVESELGKRPWIYGNDGDLGKLDRAILDEYVIWYANYGKRTYGGYNDRPRLANGLPKVKRVVGWQFTDTGHLPGYSGELDLNEWYVEPGKLIDWAGNKVTANARPQTMEVGGRIGEKWRELGGMNSVLGAPVSEEVLTEKGAYRRFEGGYIIWSLETDAHVSYGAIREKYAQYGFEHGVLGYPISDERPIRDGFFQEFQGGKIYFSNKTGAHTVWGAIYDKWAELGWENGALGYPISDEMDGLDGKGRVQQFEHGTIYWTPTTGAFQVWGLVMDRYGSMGWESSNLGYPIGPEVRESNRWVQKFQGGEIAIDDAPPLRPPAIPKPAIYIPSISEGDPKVWINMRGGEGWGCVCMKITLPLVEEAMKRAGLIKNCLDFFQFGYNRGGVAASAGMHDWGGVIDVAQGTTLEERKIWASFGWMMAPRTPRWGWNTGDHGHGGMYGCVHRTPGLAAQVRSMMNGRNGLVSNLYVDWEKPTRTWQDALRAKGLA